MTYGQALYDLAKAENLAQALLSQLAVLEESFEKEPDFAVLLSTPTLSKPERCAIVDRCFQDGVHEYVLNFLKLLTEKGHIRHFPYSCQAYRQLYNQDHNILPVEAVTALPLTQDQAQRLTNKLQGLTGKTVQLTNATDPQCMGGIRLNYDGKQLDDTVRHRLDTIRALLNNTVL